MRAHLVPALIAASIAFVPVAFAAQTATGTIKALDMKTHKLTLDNGIAYTLPTTFKDPGLKVGEKVKVSWDMKNKQHEANSVTITN